MLKTTLKIICLTLLCAYLLIAGVIYSVGNEPAVCRDIKIEIIDSARYCFIQPSSIRRQVLKTQPSPIGQKFEDINTLEIARTIENNQLIKKAYCYHTPDSLLRIDIEQRYPILRIKSEKIGDYYIDTEGELMPTQHNTALRMPLATGHINQSLAKGDLYTFALFLQDDRFWRNEITQIHVDQQGDIFLVPRVGRHTIKMGTLHNFEQKLQNLLTFYKKVLPRKGWNAYKCINLEFDGQVIGEKNNS